MNLIRYLLPLAFACLALASHAQTWAWDDGTTPYVQSPDDVVDRMLRLAEPKAGEYLIDLGSGDGRIVIEAAKRYGTRGLGVDIEPRLVELARANAAAAGVEKLAQFEVRDLFEQDLRGAAVLTLYLLPDVNKKLLPRVLDQLKPGARVVSHDYGIGDWPPDETVELTVAEKLVGPLGRSKVYLWLVPANVRGTWVSSLPEQGGLWRFSISQQYQVLDAHAFVQGREQAMRGTRLRGEELRMVVTANISGRARTHVFKGMVRGDTVEGDVIVTDGEERKVLPWTARRTK